jgi:hypothetical protein
MGDFSLDYRSQDDEEKDRLLREFLGEPAPKPVTSMSAADFQDPPSAPKPTPNAGTAADYGAGSPPPQTRLEATGRAAQAEPDELDQALRQRALSSLASHDAGPSQRQMASGPGLDAAIGPGAALILDAFVNRGRGAGQIVGAAANSMSEDRRAEQHRLDRIAEIEAHHKSADPMKALTDYGNLTARNYEDRIHQQTADTSSTRTQSLVNPESEAAKGRVQLTKDASDARRTGTLNANHEQAQSVADDAALRAGEVRTAQNDSNHQNAPVKAADDAFEAYLKLHQTGDQLAENAGKRAAAEEPYKKNLQKSADDVRIGAEQRKRDEMQREADQLSAGRPATPQQALGMQKNDTANARNYSKDVKDELPVADAGSQLMKIFEAHKDDPHGVPGLGVADSMATKVPMGTAVEDWIEGPDAKVVRENMAMLRAKYQHGLTGAASNVPEEKRIEFIAGLQPGATAEQTMNSVKMLKESSDKYLQDFAVGKEDQARAVLRNHGLDSLIRDPAPAPTPRSGAIDTLPVTGGRAVGATPGLPSDATADPPRHVTVTFPDGVTETHDLTQGQIAHLLSRAPKGTEVH